MNQKPLNHLQVVYAFRQNGSEMSSSIERSVQEKIEFHECQMNRQDLAMHWREISKHLYWHYLDLLTKPVEK